MTWVPADYSALCRQDPRFSMCSHASMLFLNLVTMMLSKSRDHKEGSHLPQCPAPVEPSPIIIKAISEFEVRVPRSSSDEQRQEYDFIIVGGGSAGCVMANRLSENEKWRVLLLEAGPEEPQVTEVPGLMSVLEQTNIDWNHRTVPQENICQANKNRQCKIIGGKTLGGSSSLNVMMYFRGNPRDYDKWQQAGNVGWSYEDVLPYFKKAEHNTDEDIVRAAPHAHGVEGNLYVGKFPCKDINLTPLLDAFRELGYPEIDVNSGQRNQLGVMDVQMTHYQGRRMSVNAAYIRPIRYVRKNLVVQTLSHVTRVLINERREAYGVKYRREGGNLEVAYARKEVILSAGTINSPKILMLSGIGPRYHLERFGIPVISDLPVGDNLHDQATVNGVFIRLPQNNAASSHLLPYLMPYELLQFIKSGQGPLGALGPLSVVAFDKSSYETEPGLPDIEYNFAPVVLKDVHLDPEHYADYNRGAAHAYTGIQIHFTLLAPRSRGCVRLNDSDPMWGPPVIDINHFSAHSPDLNIMVEGIERCLRILQTNTLRHLQMTLDDIPLPACKAHAFGTRSYWTCIARSYTPNLYNPAGTCKMGPETDPTSVVNPRLQVKGVHRLRVVDGGVIPTVPRGNLNAPIVMIAEKAADIIKQQYYTHPGYEY